MLRVFLHHGFGQYNVLWDITSHSQLYLNHSRSSLTFCLQEAAAGPSAEGALQASPATEKFNSFSKWFLYDHEFNSIMSCSSSGAPEHLLHVSWLPACLTNRTGRIQTFKVLNKKFKWRKFYLWGPCRGLPYHFTFNQLRWLVIISPLQTWQTVECDQDWNPFVK